MEFNGIVGGMADLTRLSNARSRSISAENPTGEPGMGARCELEQGSAREGLPVRNVRVQESEQVDSPVKVKSSFSYWSY